MKFAGNHDTASKYPPGYMKNISVTYQQHHLALKKLAQAQPYAENPTSENADLIEFRLLKSQEKLLELAASITIANLEDVKEVLSLWHHVAIKDVSPYDISLADGLILALHRYFDNMPRAKAR